MGTSELKTLFEPKPKGRKSKKPTVYEFELARQGMTQTEMAEYFGVSNSTICRWLREFREEATRKGGQV
jgi:excisionase family DNA binding protein